MSQDSLSINHNRGQAVQFRIESASILQSKLFAWILGFAQLVYLLLDLYRPLNLNDEGVVVYGAARILNGDVPYRDFWMVGYTPGQFYMLAGLFKVFGASVVVERVWDVLVRFAISLIVYLIARKLSSPIASATAWVLVTVALLPPSFYYGYVIFPALLFSVSSVLLLLKYVSQGGTLRLAGVGVMVGIAALFRYDIGMYSLVADGITLTLVTFDGLTLQTRAKVLRIIKTELCFILGIVTVVAPVFLYFVVAVSISTLWSDLIEVPYHVFYKARALPYPPIIPDSLTALGEWRNFYFPVLVACLALIAVIHLSRRAREANENHARIFGIIALICLTLLFFIHALNRNDEIHRTLSYVPAIVLLTILLPDVVSMIRTPLHRAIIYSGFSLIALYTVGATVLAEAQLVSLTWNAGCSSQRQLEREGCIRYYSDQRQAVEYVQTRTARDERIYVGLPRHDQIFTNDIMFYFLANRQSATKYHVLVPGVATTLPIQSQIIADIRKHNIRYVVLFAGADSIGEPNESSVSSGVTVLDDFIRRDYRIVQKFGDYSIWLRE